MYLSARTRPLRGRVHPSRRRAPRAAHAPPAGEHHPHAQRASHPRVSLSLQRPPSRQPGTRSARASPTLPGLSITAREWAVRMRPSRADASAGQRASPSVKHARSVHPAPAKSATTSRPTTRPSPVRAARSWQPSLDRFLWALSAPVECIDPRRFATLACPHCAGGHRDVRRGLGVSQAAALAAGSTRLIRVPCVRRTTSRPSCPSSSSSCASSPWGSR
jgi:hypothetical protein